MSRPPASDLSTAPELARIIMREWNAIVAAYPNERHGLSVKQIVRYIGALEVNGEPSTASAPKNIEPTCLTLYWLSKNGFLELCQIRDQLKRYRRPK